MKKVFFCFICFFAVCSFVFAEYEYDNTIYSPEQDDMADQIDRQIDSDVSAQQDDMDFEQDAPARESDEQLDNDIRTDLIDNAIV